MKTASSFSASRCAIGAPPAPESTKSSSGHAQPTTSGPSRSRPGIFRWIDANSVSLMFEGRSEDTRLNSSHDQISYAVFCLKKKKNTQNILSDRKHIDIITEY